MRVEEENTGTYQGTEQKSQELPPRAVHPAVTGTAKEGGWEVLKADGAHSVRNSQWHLQVTHKTENHSHILLR